LQYFEGCAPNRLSGILVCAALESWPAAFQASRADALLSHHQEQREIRGFGLGNACQNSSFKKGSSRA